MTADGGVWTNELSGELSVRWRIEDRLLCVATASTTVAVGGRSTVQARDTDRSGGDWEQRVGGSIRAILLSPDSVDSSRMSLAAVGNDGDLLLWDPIRQPLMRTVEVSSEPLWAMTRVTVDGHEQLVCSGDDRAIHLIDLDTESSTLLLSHTGRGRALTTLNIGGVEHILSAGTDGTIRVWNPATKSLVDRWPRLPTRLVQTTSPGTQATTSTESTDPRPRSDRGVDFTNVGGDDVAPEDRLEREALAVGLAAQLIHWGQMSPQNGSRVMPVLIDAPWGAGKSTLLALLRRELTRNVGPTERPRQPWIVPESFDAWRESQVGAAWWSLLNHMRRAIARQGCWFGQRVFGLWGFWNRLCHAVGGAWFAVMLFPATLLIGLAVTDHWPFDNAGESSSATTTTAETATSVTSPTAVPTTISASSSTAAAPNPGVADTVADLADLADSVTKLIVFGGLAMGAWFVVVRIGLWYTPLGARLQQKASENPMDAVISHVQWMRRRARQPIALVIDDLDRCRADYVVAVLETLQTLVRQGSNDGKTVQPLVFIVAADSAWLRSAIEQHYDEFAPQVGRPGRSLGWLFLDKLFPLRVRVVDAESAAVEDFTRSVLEISESGETGDDSTEAMPETAEIERQIIAAPSLAEKKRLSQSPVRAVQARLRVVSARSSVTESTLEQASHELAEYVPEIARISNPRTIKQFRNSYVLNWVATNGEPDTPTIVRWTLIEVQWPDLAERLRREPDLLTAIHSRTTQSDDPLALLLVHPDLRRVAQYLEPAIVRTMLRLPPSSGSLDEPQMPPGASSITPTPTAPIVP